MAVSTAPLPDKLDAKRYITLDVVDPPKSHGYILYARARVNGRDAIVYIDTGYSASFIDTAFANGLAEVERPGRFPVFRQHVPVTLGRQEMVLDEVRESPIDRGPGLDLPVALALGSDVLSRFIVTIDLRAKKLVLALAN